MKPDAPAEDELREAVSVKEEEKEEGKMKEEKLAGVGETKKKKSKTDHDLQKQVYARGFGRCFHADYFLFI